MQTLSISQEIVRQYLTSIMVAALAIIPASVFFLYSVYAEDRALVLLSMLSLAAAAVCAAQKLFPTATGEKKLIAEIVLVWSGLFAVVFAATRPAPVMVIGVALTMQMIGVIVVVAYVAALSLFRKAFPNGLQFPSASKA